MRLAEVRLRDAVIRCLTRHGVPDEHAVNQADLLVDAELSGHASHGVLRLPTIVERIRNGVADPCATGRSEWRGAAFLAVDGCRGLGPVVALDALAQAGARVRTTGIVVAAVHGANHLGRLAWYVEKVAREGLVAIALSTSEALVHPWGGARAMVGSNPIAIGVPAEPEPFVLDMATGAVSMGRIHAYAHRGQPLPDGWALDAEGRPTTDAKAAKTGSIAPFGGPKGYALGLAFEVLVSTLTGAALGTDVCGTLDDDRPANKGDLFIVATSQGGAAVTASVSAYLDEIRRSPATDGQGVVTVPGDRTRQTRERHRRTGVDVPDALWARICELAGERTAIGGTGRG